MNINALLARITPKTRLFRIVIGALALVTLLTAAPASAQRATLVADGIPLANLLASDGTLEIPPGLAGTINVSGYQLVGDLDGAPRFAAAVGDWQAGFSDPGGGVNSRVRALAFDSSGNLYAGGDFYNAGGVPANRIAMWDGSSWSALGNGMNNTVYALAFDSSGNLYAGGNFTSPYSRIAKWDGNSWGSLGSGMNNIVYSLAVDNSNTLYAGGAFTFPAGRIAKWNGSSWSGLGSGMNNTVYALAVDSSNNLYAGGTFSSPSSRIAKWNGSFWSSLGSGTNSTVYALAADSSGNVYVGGTFSSPYSRIAKWNGSSWSSLGGGMNNTVYSLALDNSGNLYAGGFFTSPYSRVAKWNGGTWTSLGSGMNTYVYALAVDSSNALFAGGEFTSAGGSAANYVAHWGGSSWSTLGGGGNGTNNNVYALAIDSSGNLYAGGLFTFAGATAVNYIARWDGSSWSPLGSGVSSYVYALVVDNSDNLYAGGIFTVAGGMTANRVAMWDGSSWSALGDGLNSTVYALAVDSSSNVYAGGSFTTAGTTAVNYIAQWDGANWSDLGGGVDSTVYALAVDTNDHLFAGGAFATAGSATANFVAQWDGASWNALGSGMDSAVWALVFDSNSDLFAGGQFTTAGGLAANRIAQWDGSSWSALDSGVNSTVRALAFDDSGALYAGGYFSTAGGTTVNRIAQWDGSSWSGLGSGMDNYVFALAFDSGGDLFAGGFFNNVGDIPSRGVAKYIFIMYDGGTGPGGVGTDDGTSSAELWLQADTAVFADTACLTAAANLSDVGCWQDQSGNGRHFTQSNPAHEPTYRTAIVNGRSVLGFDETQQDYLSNATDVALAAGDDTFTYFAIWYPDFANQAVVFEQNSPSAAQGKRAALLQLTGFYGFNGESNDAHIVPYTPASWKLTSLLLNGDASNNVHLYDSGTAYIGSISMALQDVGAYQMLVGKKSNDDPPEYFDGDIAEIIVFSHDLNSVERILVENYLSAYYDLSLGANDYYDGDSSGNGDFDVNVAGIGQESDGAHSLAQSAGIIVRDVSFLNDNGDYMLFGRQSTDCTETSADVPTDGDWAVAPSPARWGCSWYFDVTDVGATTGSGTIDIGFDYSAAGIPGGDTPDAPVDNYGLLRRADATGQFEDITASCVSGAIFIDGDRLIFRGVDSTCLGSNFTLGSKDAENSTLPVTLAHVSSRRQSDGGVAVTWQTATETGTVGFNLYGVAADGSLVKLTERVTLATGVATVVPQTYRVTVPDWGGDTFYIEDIGIRSETDRHGPFTVGQPSGRLVTPTPIDWPTIHTQHATRAAERQAAALNAVRQTFTPSLQATPAASIDVLVSRTGLQRITYADLVAFGIDPAGLPANRLALLHNGQPVPITVLGGNTVGPNTVIEFLGTALDSLYTATNVYSLTVNPAEALRVGRDTRAVPPDAPAPFYLETVTVEEENTYSYLAPNGDPWYAAWMMAYGGAYSRDFVLPVDHLATGADAVLHLDVWGLTDWPVPGDDHRLQVSLNGTLLADVTFDGLVSQLLDITLPAGLLAEGDNTLTLTVPQPADPDVWWDIIILDSYGVTYPRAFVAVDNSLTFTAAGAAFEVDGLTALDGAVYRVSADNTLSRLARAIPTANGDGTYRVKFRGSPEPATYYVAATTAMATPDLAAAQPFTDITSGSADYLMLTHPDFVDGLTDLATHHATRGLTVKIVDVTDVYAQFSFGVVDPAAIQEYIEHAVTNMGVQYVLLVGGDTYDYFDRLGLGSISFIPSLYGPTEPYVSFAPLDPLYTDVDGDGVPDVPIGRFPVRTPAELAIVIAKTLAYAANTTGPNLLLAADTGYSVDSDRFVTDLPEAWSVTQAYLDLDDVATARQTVLDTINGNVRLTSFLGHSGPANWTYAGLFNADDAWSLTNSAPTVVTQWGCWNTYHVDPLYDTLGHAFMLNESGGAAAVLGASTLTQESSDRVLGPEVMRRATETGVPLGVAIQEAKAALAHPGLADVVLGWSLLGDPALLVAP